MNISRSRSSSRGSSSRETGSTRCLQLPRELYNGRIEARSPAKDIDRLETASRDEPRERVAGQPVTRPTLDSCGECLMQRLFGQVEITDKADEGGQNTARVRAVERLDVARATGVSVS